MSLSRKPTTVKELKAALAKLPDSQKIEIYEDADITKMPAISSLRAKKVTVICLL
ncbi:MAG: hypothetical protein ACK440_08630 [Sphingomonadaceae bacterium]|jgi:hypothetical protein